jgi:hypothetical protein
MAKLKDMSAEPVKKGEAEAAPVIKTKRVRSKRKIHRAGYGSFKPTVIMKNLGGQFVKVKRDAVLAHIDLGWATVPRSKYREAIRAGEAAVAVAEVAAKRKKK